MGKTYLVVKGYRGFHGNKIDMISHADTKVFEDENRAIEYKEHMDNEIGNDYYFDIHPIGKG